MYLRICVSLKSAKKNLQIAKICSPHIANPQTATFAEDPQIYKKKSVNLRICDLRNLFADRPNFEGR
jgi:hypothetical protein